MIQLSKKQIDLIGDRIRSGTATPEDYEQISKIRSNYVPLIRCLRDSLKNFKDSKDLKGGKVVISRRIKRMPSIIKKIERFDTMKLSRIQDFGGVRVVLDTVTRVRKLSNRLKNETYRLKGKNNFVIVKEHDYIEKPKEDGYRSIHQIYKYQGNRYPELKGLNIELQIRTVKQHQWATAVEILDMILNSSLKTGVAEPQYKEFFKLCSCAIAYEENNHSMPKCHEDLNINEVLERIFALDNEYHIFDKLLSVSVITNSASRIASITPSDYLILILDIAEKEIRVKTFEDKEDAEAMYKHYEEQTQNDSGKDVVMVSIEDIGSLKKAYPNYFLDAKGFVNMIKNLKEKK